MGFFSFLLLLAGLWLLWNISRNTADALDKQTALQYEIVALEKRVEERFAELTNLLISGQHVVQVVPDPLKVAKGTVKPANEEDGES